MTKKVAFGPKPTLAVTPDQWVERRAPEERMKRLTIDIPVSLVRIKTQCASRDEDGGRDPRLTGGAFPQRRGRLTTQPDARHGWWLWRRMK